jgi:hypothetical protein
MKKLLHFIIFILPNYYCAQTPCIFPTSPPYTLNISLQQTWQTINGLSGYDVYSGDMYIFNANQNDTVIFSFCQGGGNAASTTDTYMTLYNSSNIAVKVADDECGLYGGPSELIYAIPATGTYKLYITNWDAQGTNPCNADGSTIYGDMAFMYFHTQPTGQIPLQLSLGQGTFIEGVSNVNNFISVNPNDVPQGTVSAVFALIDSTGQSAISGTTQIDNNASDGWGVNIDMGITKLNCFAYAEFRDNNNNTIDYGFTQLDVTPKPSWLNTGGTAVANSINGSVINITGTYPINSVTQTIPNSIKGIGNKSLDLTNCHLSLNINYNYSNRSSIINTSKANLELNTLDIISSTRSIDFNQGSINLDNSFNLNAFVKDSISLAKYDANLPGLKFPVCPGVNIKIDAGVSFYADLKGQIVLGTSNGQFGFYNNSNQKTKFIARLQAAGFIRGNVNVLYGAASATARLDVTSRLGVGFEYQNIPSNQLVPLFGGDIDISGTVELKTFWGFGPNRTYGSYSFYNSGFGNFSAGNKSSVKYV